MNNMKKQELLKLRKFSGYVGDFIRYWGFRRIHGQIWTVIYLSPEPKSGVEIVELLKVSKALVSPALKELEKEGLITQVRSENSKTKRYQAEEDVEKIVKGVLHRREKPMLKKISESFAEMAGKDGLPIELKLDRLRKMEAMIQAAQLSLELLLNSDQLLG